MPPRSAVPPVASPPSIGNSLIDLSGAENIEDVVIRDCSAAGGFDGVARVQGKNVRNVRLIDNEHSP